MAGGRKPCIEPGRRVLAVAVFLLVPCAAMAGLDLTIRPATELPVELLRPDPAEAFEGGRTAVVSWRASQDLESTGIREWEAFLSYDGGNEWPVRITPHLDIAHSSFRFVVPRIPSEDVRLMLRFGDEEHEIGYVLPHRFRCVLPLSGWSLPTLQRPVFGRGEVARPGAPGVVLWVEGDRHGRNRHIRATTWQVEGLTNAQTVPALLWVIMNAPPPNPTQLEPPAQFGASSKASWSESETVSSALLCFALLSLLCRQNE